MKIKNLTKYGYLFSLLIFLLLTEITANGQSIDSPLFPRLSYGTNQAEGTKIENANYRNLKNELSIQYNDELDRIDREFHRCTSQNRGNHQGIQNCINAARDAKQHLSVERQRLERMLDIEHIARFYQVGRYWDNLHPGTNRRDGTNGRTYVETRPKPKVNRGQGVYRKGKIVRNY